MADEVEREFGARRSAELIREAAGPAATSVNDNAQAT
jgi:hypothetical protein